MIRTSIPVPCVLALTLCALPGACTTSSGGLGGVDESGEGGDDGGGPGGGNEGSATSTGGNDDDGDGDGESGDTGAPPVSCVGVGSSSARALDGIKWHNVVADLLGVQSQVEPQYVELVPYPRVLPSEDLAALYQAEAAVVAANADLGALLPCEADATGAAADDCMVELATDLGRLAFRRPLADDEIDALVDVGSGATADMRARNMIQMLLSSSQFWLVDETGTEDPSDPGAVILGEYAIASRLAFFVWNSTPDDALLLRAAAGELSDPAVRAAEVDRMLADPRAARAIGDYWDALLDTRSLDSGDHSPEVFPAFDATVVDSMREEVRRYASDVVLTEGTWSALLGATRSFVNGPLAAAVYDGDIVGEPPASNNPALVEFNPERRPGLLTRAAPLARWTQSTSIGFTMRGVFVRSRLLCDPVPPPPPDVDINPSDDPIGDLSRYELIEVATADPACRTCHALTDTITFAFDNYDPIGRWQTEITQMGHLPEPGDPTVPVDTSGEVVGLSGDGTFENRDGLLEILATAPEVLACQAQHQLVFALGRDMTDTDACALGQLQDTFIENEGDLRQLVHDIVASDTFVRARPE